MRTYALDEPLPPPLSQTVTLDGPPPPLPKRDIIIEWPLKRCRLNVLTRFRYGFNFPVGFGGFLAP